VADGDRAAIHWVFDFTGTGGKRLRLDQIAYQTWKDGKIVHERFYYDPTSPV
jgi:ketosteroid isomerase-like protein